MQSRVTFKCFSERQGSSMKNSVDILSKARKCSCSLVRRSHSGVSPDQLALLDYRIPSKRTCDSWCASHATPGPSPHADRPLGSCSNMPALAHGHPLSYDERTPRCLEAFPIMNLDSCSLARRARRRPRQRWESARHCRKALCLAQRTLVRHSCVLR